MAETEAQKRAKKKWDDAHKAEKKLYQYRSYAKSYVRNLASREDLLELKQLIEDQLKK